LDPPIEMISIKEQENNNHNALDRNDEAQKVVGENSYKDFDNQVESSVRESK